MASHGPISFPTGAADSFVWAQLEYAAVVADGFTWAHRHMQLLLLMVLHGPIDICSCFYQWLRMGPSK